MKKRLFRCLLCIVVFVILLAINQVFYLAKVQFVCTEKIERGEDLNLYETLSAYQTHTALWMFGGFLYPNTAYVCFCKQFFITDPWWTSALKDNAETIKAKRELDRLYELDSKHNHKIRLVWKNYKDDTSLLLNGSYISKTIIGDEGSEMWAYTYSGVGDYKPGIIKVGPITLCETVFNYLENKHIISNYTYEPNDSSYTYIDE